MEIFDVTVAVRENMPIYAGDPPVSINAVKSLAADGVNLTVLSLCGHTGTHVDAPNHFIDGAKRIHELDLRKLVGPCIVVSVEEDVIEILPEHLPDLVSVERLIFKTKNSAFWAFDEFRKDFTYLSLEAAQIMAAANIKLVGIDYLSIEKSGAEGHPVHVRLLEKEIVILEGLDLRNIEPGEYEIVCLPLKYKGGLGDGSPARTILIKK